MLVESRGAHGSVVLTLHRPEVRNALDLATLRRLACTLENLANDREVRTVVLTGAGGVFASGGDLAELRDRTSEADAAELSELGYQVTTAVERLPVPVVAVLTGPAVGGGAELALACDVRIAEPAATMGFRHARMAVTTSWGSAARLVGRTSASTASRLLFGAEDVGADELARLGLVDELVQPGEGLARAEAFARAVALGSPTAIANLKALVLRAAAPPAGLRDEERARFVATWTAPDHAEAVEAFFGRRAARFAPRSA